MIYINGSISKVAIEKSYTKYENYIIKGYNPKI